MMMLFVVDSDAARYHPRKQQNFTRSVSRTKSPRRTKMSSSRPMAIGQRKQSLVLGKLAAVTVAAITGGVVAQASSPALQLDMYRAMESGDVARVVLENFDLASLEGALKYVHTEVIVESAMGDPYRTSRKNGVDTISRYPFKVRNPHSVLEPGNNMVNSVDFGPFVTFDNGIATNMQTQSWIQTFGGYVGVQEQNDLRWPYVEPYFWFSVTGWCPNVRYDQIPMSREEAEAIWEQRESICSHLEAGMACRVKSDICEVAGGSCVPRSPVPQCLSAGPRPVLGGLCPGAAGVLKEPTGEPGCTYSYGEAELISLDNIAGITSEDCGGRLCESWMDFRQHCSNPAYRFKFDMATGAKVAFPFCVEYDVAPACAANCYNPDCQAIAPEDREIGVPFWQGRCKALANLGRVSKVKQSQDLQPRGGGGGSGSGSGSGSGFDHIAVHGGDKGKAKKGGGGRTCISSVPGPCAPAPGQGGNYCTRTWSGVCTTCFVPGTLQPWAAASWMPYCPYEILKTRDYLEFAPPQCASSHPSDRCCLYTGSCDILAGSAAEAPLDEDGFALVTSWGNSSAIVEFLGRVAASRGSHLAAEMESRLQQFVVERWSGSPRRGDNLDGAVQMMSDNELL